jgi:hypothetical protein
MKKELKKFTAEAGNDFDLANQLWQIIEENST